MVAWNRKYSPNTITLPQFKRPRKAIVEEDLRAELDPMLNEGQKSALLHMLRFVKQVDENMFVLKGYAGTGKSFLINRFLKEVLKIRNSKEIAITAPTNKAVKVLKRGRVSDISVHYLTIHSLLGLTQSIDSKGRISFKAEKKSKYSINRIKILIVDETSMLDDHLFGLLEDEVIKNKGSLRIIFVGDYAQIPPVGKDDCIPFKRGLSNGYSEEGYTLREIMRQKGENAIVSTAYDIRENLKDPFVTAGVKTSINALDQGIVVVNKEIDLINLYKSTFGTISFAANSDHAKVIAWTNATVKKHNSFIRNMLFNNPKAKIVSGDRLIANSPIISKNEILYNTSDEFEVLGCVVKEVSLGVKLKVYEARVREDVMTSTVNTIQILHEDSYQEFQNKLDTLKQRAIETSNTMSWILYYDFAKLFADVAYNYAVTAHKAQGSTYNNVFVIEEDINQNRNVVERNRIKYTAYTRASQKLFIYKEK